jgi:hypothetical protein
MQLCLISLQLAEMLANAILALVDGYWSRVVIVTTTKVGQCHPLSQVYNATVVAVCNKILDPIVSCDIGLLFESGVQS